MTKKLTRINNLRLEILNLLWAGPKRFTELQRATGASKEGVSKALKWLREKEYVQKEQGRLGPYFITFSGREYLRDVKKTNRLFYDYKIVPKLDERINTLPFSFEGFPAPITYHVRMSTSPELEDLFLADRAYWSWIGRREYSRQDTASSLVYRLVNEFFWEILLRELFHAAMEYKYNGYSQLEFILPYRLQISLDIDFQPTETTMRNISALLMLLFLKTYRELSMVSCFDIIKMLEEKGYAPKGATELLKQASKERKTRRKLRKPKAVEALIRQAATILIKNGLVDLEALKKILWAEYEEYEKILEKGDDLEITIEAIKYLLFPTREPTWVKLYDPKGPKGDC
ncbi:MAG: winged helix-turn-helix domain-containing protein [Nitrososphaerota archaeon]